MNEETNEISWDDFSKIEMRVGTVVKAEEFPEAKKPAYKLQIDFGELTNLGKYKIEKEGYEPNSNERIASLFIFSRVVLNSDQTKAVYYFQEFQRRLDGYGYIVFAEWTAAGWKVIGKNMVWIS